MKLDGKKILVTGATGMVGKPIAESLAGRSEVIAAARFKDPDAKAELEKAGVQCVSADLMSGDLSGLPDVDVVVHLGVVKSNKWDKDLDGNAAAGILAAAYGVEMTAFVGRCLTCGDVRPFAETAAYLRPASAVLRCTRCDAVLVVIVERAGVACVDTRGVEAVG